MQAEEITFPKFKSNVKKKEGIVCLGCGGDPKEWIDGVTKLLNDEKIVTGTSDEVWNKIYILKTTGNRTDIAFVSDNCLKDFNVGKMAIWRLRMGDCSWISDYLVNYKQDFTKVATR